jgi:prolyl 4-hydroxylase
MTKPRSSALQPPRGASLSAAVSEATEFDKAGRHLDAIATLSRAAAAGDLIAKRTVGLRILLGDRAPLMGPEGVRLLAEAAAHGDARSAELCAVLTGAGIYRAQCWSDALDWLQSAAELGSARARGALRALSADPTAVAEADSRETWGRLRSHVDLRGLLSPCPLRSLHQEPLVRSAANFAPPALCHWLISQARGRLTRAEVYNPDTGGLERTDERTNTSAIINIIEADLAQILVQARIAVTLGASFGHLEPAFVLHYSPGQTFHDHYDFVDPEIPGYREEIARNGQRVATFLIYLNEDYEGGRTDFPRLGLSHKGKAGEGFVFANVGSDGRADTRTLHAGRPPSRGEKWILSQFVRDRVVVPGYQAGSPRA